VKRKASPLGSSSSTEGSETRVRVGVLGRPHGLDGSLGLYIDPADLVYVQVGATVVVLDEPYTVRAVRPGTKGPLITFEEVSDRETAETIRGNHVYAAERRALSVDEYWPEDLVGLEVRPGGGVVTAVAHGATQARLVVSRGEETFEVPFVADLVPVVDIAAGFVEVVDLPGLSSPSDRE
jgi:16S rRNA processing protein RimM